MSKPRLGRLQYTSTLPSLDPAAQPRPIAYLEFHGVPHQLGVVRRLHTELDVHGEHLVSGPIR